MDEDNETLLVDLCNKYFTLKQRFQNKEFTKKTPNMEIPLAPHDSNYTSKFKELYQIELSVEEMVELRDFAENDFPDFMQDKMEQDRNNGMSDVNLKGIF
jgi:hypothetical protein